MSLGLSESSGYSLEGSLTKDLTTSKVWLISEVEKIKKSFSTIYILGSWYANMSLYIKVASNIQAKKIINVDTDSKFLSMGHQLLKLAGQDDNVVSMRKDANQLNYKQLGKDGLVINTSLTDMKGQDWFDNIPQGTLVALQARDQDPGEPYSSAEDILKRFPLKTLYTGQLHLQDPETEYNRFMVIGVK